MPRKYTSKTILKKKWPFIILKLSHKKSRKMRKKTNLPQNTVCLEQQIYANQEYFTQLLVVMVEPFRRSVLMSTDLNIGV